MNMIQRLAVIALAASLQIVSVGPLVAQTSVPDSISFQGYVADTAGAPLSGKFRFGFALYDGPTKVWEEAHLNVQVTNGIFNVLLGSGTLSFGFPPLVDLPFDRPYELGFHIESDPEFLPRTPLASAPYALGLRVPITLVADTTGGSVISVENLATSDDESFGLRGRTHSPTASGVFGTGPVYGVTGAAGETSGTNYGVLGASGSTTGRGVFGWATSVTGGAYGVVGQTQSTGGRGVYGLADAATGTNYGVYGRSDSGVGYGVFGRANSASGANYGVYGETISPTGHGVYGYASGNGGVNYGVYGVTDAESGRGVYGTGTRFGVFGDAAGLLGQGDYTYGVYGTADAQSGYGVYGTAGHSTGDNAGVYGQSSSSNGFGVYGYAIATTGSNIGVHARTNSSSGRALVADANSANGNTIGVYSEVESADGYSGQFFGGRGVHVEADANTAADLTLGGNNNGDDGRIYSDPAFPDSDILLFSYDNIYMQLDEDASNANSEFRVRTGNTTLFTVQEDGDVIVGATVVHTSDRDRKDDFTAIDSGGILDAVARLPILKWRYKGQDVFHIGPTAQDFSAAFDIGADNKTIALVDADGVALAAIQALYDQVRRENDELRTRVEALERLLDSDR